MLDQKNATLEIETSMSMINQFGSEFTHRCAQLRCFSVRHVVWHAVMPSATDCKPFIRGRRPRSGAKNHTLPDLKEFRVQCGTKLETLEQSFMN